MTEITQTVPVPQVGEFWESRHGSARTEIVTWLNADTVLERYVRMGTVEEAHAEALEHNALVTAPVSPEVLAAKTNALWALDSDRPGWFAEGARTSLEHYQDVMDEHGMCLIIGCHVFTPTVRVCPTHLRGNAS